MKPTEREIRAEIIYKELCLYEYNREYEKLNKQVKNNQDRIKYLLSEIKRIETEILIKNYELREIKHCV